MTDFSFEIYNSAALNYSAAAIRFDSSVSSMEDYNAKLAELRDDGTPLELVYELAEPIVYQLTPQQIRLLRGNNVLQSADGSTELTYYVDDVIMLQKQIDELRATLLENTNG